EVSPFPPPNGTPRRGPRCRHRQTRQLRQSAPPPSALPPPSRTIHPHTGRLFGPADAPLRTPRSLLPASHTFACWLPATHPRLAARRSLPATPVACPSETAGRDRPLPHRLSSPQTPPVVSAAQRIPCSGILSTGRMTPTPRSGLAQCRPHSPRRQ